MDNQYGDVVIYNQAHGGKGDDRLYGDATEMAASDPMADYTRGCDMASSVT
jgi:hypothetical protein